MCHNNLFSAFFFNSLPLRQISSPPQHNWSTKTHNPSQQADKNPSKHNKIKKFLKKKNEITVQLSNVCSDVHVLEFLTSSSAASKPYLKSTKEHSHQECYKIQYLASQKVILFILITRFTIHLTSKVLLFYHFI